jgi:predicted ATP-grasp superfamily ATP-dependent carboligase
VTNVNHKARVFVSDGSYRNALAAVRALSRAGFHVTVGERRSIEQGSVISFWSRHCAERFQYPDQRSDATAAAAALAEHFRTNAYDVAIPVGLEMTELFIRHRELLAVPMMLPPAESFEIAADKRRTFEHAAAAGIPIPRTVPAAQWEQLQLPIVFKHPQTGVTIAQTANEARAQAEHLGASIDRYVAQEFIPGENGYGYFGFFQHGRETGYFMHERLMQFPKEGGPSVVARAIRNDRLHELGRALLESLNWHGVAMVEFKQSDRDGEFYLIEINPKLWGSLDLAIQAGCNFPVWLARATIDGSPPDSNGYADGLVYQAVMPNGVKSFVRYPAFRKQFLRNIFSRSVKTDLWLLDPLPTAAGLFAMVRNVAR